MPDHLAMFVAPMMWLLSALNRCGYISTARPA
jgi:hypothetical protein